MIICAYVHIYEVTDQLIFMNTFPMIQHTSQPQEKNDLISYHKRDSFLFLFYNLHI